MDEMKIITKFSRGIVSKIVERIIHKSFGCRASIRLNDMNVTNDNDKAHIHLDIEADLEHSELLNILKNVGLG